jgi:hypothetical protein
MAIAIAGRLLIAVALTLVVVPAFCALARPPMWQWARAWIARVFWREFCRGGSQEDVAIQLTEGWILGSDRNKSIKTRPFLTDRPVASNAVLPTPRCPRVL